MTRQSYTYTSNPHAAPRALFSQSVPLTMMSDPRVVRGNTHTLAKKAALLRAQQAEEEAKRKTAEEAKHQQQEQARTSMHAEPTAPYYRFEVKPFSSADFSLSQYLEAADDLDVRTRDVTTEMDALNERPATPEYIPRKTGVDRETQVEDVAELFDFDLEVQPMLEVIVQKTLEQALLEVNAEEEINALQEQVTLYHSEKEKEEQWAQQQLEQIKAAEVELEHQRRDIIRKKRREIDVKVQVAGLNMMRQIVPSMMDSISDEQAAKGAWKSSDRVQFERSIWPSTLQQADQQRNAYFSAQQVLDGKPSPTTSLRIVCPSCKADLICLSLAFLSVLSRFIIFCGGAICAHDAHGGYGVSLLSSFFSVLVEQDQLRRSSGTTCW